MDEFSSQITLTGASGFIGHAVWKRIERDANHKLRLIFRGEPLQPVASAMESGVDFMAGSDCERAVLGSSVVIHAAARVHIMSEQTTDPLAEFRKINVAGTLNLARFAASAGVKRFVFLSSIKVNGEATLLGRPYKADDVPKPEDPYALSKWEAEQGLLSVARETGMEVVIIRPVLVYGPGVKANFRSMMTWLNKGTPLPLGAIHNKRSLVALDNLVDLIMTCIDHPAAVNQTFLVSDGNDISTTELLQRMGTALGKPARLLPVPMPLLQVGAALLGKREVAQRLCGSLQVDISKTQELLGWQPPVSVDEAMRRTAEVFLCGGKDDEPLG